MRIGTIIPNLQGESDSGPHCLHELMKHDWTVFVTIPIASRDDSRNEVCALGVCIEAEVQTGVSVVGVCDATDLAGLGCDNQVSSIGSRNQVAFWSCAEGGESVDVGHHSRVFFSESFKKSKGVLIVGPDRRVHLSMSLPACSTLNPLEIARCLKALTVVHGKPLATPANWKFGEDLIVGTSLDDAAAERAYGPVRTVLSYLRYVTFPRHLISSTNIDRE